MDDLEQILRRQIGPFPVWQWLVIILAGIALAVAVRRFTGADDPEPLPGGAGGDPTQGGPFAGTQPTGGVLYNPTYSGVADQEDAADDLTMPESNREWLARASALLRDSGSYSAAAIDTALRRYLTGRELDAQLYGIVDAALAAAGPPPEGAPAIRRAEVEPDPGPTGGSGGGSTPTTSGDEQLRRQIRAIFDKYGFSVTSSRLTRLVREVRGGRSLASIDSALAAEARKRDGSSSSSSSSPKRGSWYVIVSGDTLWSIAERAYGDGSKYPRIWDRNRNSLRSNDPDLIYPGERIYIP